MNERQQKCPYYETKCDDLQCFCPKYKAYIDVQNPQLVANELSELGVTDNMDSFEKMMTIQKCFANRFHPVNKVDKEITDKWNKEYCICIEDEVEELMDYCKLPIQDKAKCNNAKELKKEVIDILHFMMDIFISGNYTYDQLYSSFNKKRNTSIRTFNDIFKYCIDEMKTYKLERNSSELDLLDSRKNLISLWKYNNEALSYAKWNEVLLSFVLELLFVNREIRQQISWKHWKKPNISINYDKLYNAYEKLFYKFMRLAAFIFEDANEIVDTYIKKNIENIRRQKNGY